MSKITHLMWHCAATRQGAWFDRSDIMRWHLEYRKWSRVGYAGIILLDGRLDILIPHDRDDYIDRWEISNGAKGWNGVTKHFCYIGGLNKNGAPHDTRNPVQLAAMEAITKLYTMLWPDIKVIGHNQVSKKDCPCFDVPKWCDEIGIANKNIDRTDYVR